MPGAVVQHDPEFEVRRRDAVLEAYSAAARDPAGSHPFAVGRELAEGVGYSPRLLDGMPEAAVGAFSGVAAVGVDARVEAGDRVLDLGCGSGLDTLLAARQTGDAGRVVGLDFSADVLRRARGAVGGAPRVLLARAAAERLPFPDASVDTVLSNGIFNLNPARATIFAQLARVVRPGGRVHAAELVLREPLAEVDRTEAGWFD